MPDRQYVKCKFPSSPREYTYHNDGAPVAIGAIVDVETKNGIVPVEVTGVDTEMPSFPTKPIIGISETA